LAYLYAANSFVLYTIRLASAQAEIYPLPSIMVSIKMITFYCVGCENLKLIGNWYNLSHLRHFFPKNMMVLFDFLIFAWYMLKIRFYEPDNFSGKELMISESRCP
jgi:hypothetical protein